MIPGFEFTHTKKNLILFLIMFSMNIRPIIQTPVSHYQLLDAIYYICLTECTGTSKYVANNRGQAEEMLNN